MEFEDHAVNKLTVKLTNGSERIFATENSNEWYRGEIQGKGCLTIIRVWDGGVCCGKTAEASFAEGAWLEWTST